MLKCDKIFHSESVGRTGVRKKLGTDGYSHEYLDIAFAGLTVRESFIIEVNATVIGWLGAEVSRTVEHIHDGQRDIERVHFLDCCFPVFDFNGTFTICDNDNLSCPGFLTCKVSTLGLDTDNQGING